MSSPSEPSTSESSSTEGEEQDVANLNWNAEPWRPVIPMRPLDLPPDAEVDDVMNVSI